VASANLNSVNRSKDSVENSEIVEHSEISNNATSLDKDLKRRSCEDSEDGAGRGVRARRHRAGHDESKGQDGGGGPQVETVDEGDDEECRSCDDSKDGTGRSVRPRLQSPGHDISKGKDSRGGPQVETVDEGEDEEVATENEEGENEEKELASDPEDWTRGAKDVLNEVAREKRERKATKPDDATVPEYLEGRPREAGKHLRVGRQCRYFMVRLPAFFLFCCPNDFLYVCVSSTSGLCTLNNTVFIERTRLGISSNTTTIEYCTVLYCAVLL
jgi:hypothetical protein